MKTFYIIICLLLFALNQQIIRAQQPLAQTDVDANMVLIPTGEFQMGSNDPVSCN